MYAIVLKGPKSCGKSTTLNKVKNELENNGWVIKIRERYDPRKRENEKTDYFYVLKNKIETCTIGIITYGDIQRDTYNAMVRMSKEFNADIVVVAYNDRFSNQVYAKFDNTVFLKTVDKADQKDANQTDVNKIIKHLRTKLEELGYSL